MNAFPLPTVMKLPRMLRFAVVGSIGTAIDAGVFTSLHAVAGMPSVLANIVAFGTGVFNNFILHRRWTYAGIPRRSAGEQAILFLAVSFIALAINTLLVLLGERILAPFVAPLSKQASWLLPFGLWNMLLLIFTSRLRWPLEPKHQAVVLWGGWLVIGVVFFSVAGFFHEYYLSMLAAPLAALVGIGAAEMIRIYQQHPRLGASLLLSVVAATIAFQMATAYQTVGGAWWLAVSVALFVIGASLVIVALKRNARQLAVAGLSAVFAAMLVIPGVWTGLTAFAENNHPLPSAYRGGSVPLAQPNTGGNNNPSAFSSRLALLEENTQGMKYLLAVPSSQQGAEYVLATNRLVLYLGGFNGSDQVLSSGALASLVANGELRYILLGGNGGPSGGTSSISTWVTSSCKVVSGTVGAATGQAGNGAGGGETSILYDCAG